MQTFSQAYEILVCLFLYSLDKRGNFLARELGHGLAELAN